MDIPLASHQIFCVSPQDGHFVPMATVVICVPALGDDVTVV